MDSSCPAGSSATTCVSFEHQRITLHVTVSESRRNQRNKTQFVHYPIRTPTPTRVHDELLVELISRGVRTGSQCEDMGSSGPRLWLKHPTHKKMDTQRARRIRRRVQTQARTHLLTRKSLHQTIEEEFRLAQTIRLGLGLERTKDSLRWQFKRASNWEKDQTITELKQINRQPFRTGNTIANHFASEWRPILCQTHSTVPTTALNLALHDFVTMPTDRILTQADNELQMEPFSLAEVLRAITSLSRHKAAGPDGLNNDFIKDYQAILAPGLFTIGNDLLQGRSPSASFLEGLIIPLRKTGDSADAMDYRPIALLQSGYKVVAKVLSHRVQRVLGVPINDTQQGFVHGRQMSKTVMMMMAQLITAAHEPDRDPAASRAILLLDFRKAYDTVSRDFCLRS